MNTRDYKKENQFPKRPEIADKVKYILSRDILGKYFTSQPMVIEHVSDTLEYIIGSIESLGFL